MKSLQPEIEEVKPARREKEDRKGRSKRGARKEAQEFEVQEQPKEPELTAMQIAWQEALDRANLHRKSKKVRRVKAGANGEQEDILHRTLEKRLPTGS